MHSYGREFFLTCERFYACVYLIDWFRFGQTPQSLFHIGFSSHTFSVHRDLYHHAKEWRWSSHSQFLLLGQHDGRELHGAMGEQNNVLHRLRLWPFSVTKPYCADNDNHPPEASALEAASLSSRKKIRCVVEIFLLI